MNEDQKTFAMRAKVAGFSNEEIEKMIKTGEQPIHYTYSGGFCGNCAKSAKTITIRDWYPANGNIIPSITICKPCLTQMLRDFQ